MHFLNFQGGPGECFQKCRYATCQLIPTPRISSPDLPVNTAESTPGSDEGKGSVETARYF